MSQTGMPFYDAACRAAYNASRRIAQDPERAMSGKSQRHQIRARWGIEWHELLRLLHAQGLTRDQCALAMGYRNGHSLACALRLAPEHDPWIDTPLRTVPAQYFHDTGEPFADAVRRMMAEGLSMRQTAREIGYAPTAHSGLLYAMKQYGIEPAFVPRSERPVSEKYARRKALADGAPRLIAKAGQAKPRTKPKASGHVHPWAVSTRQSFAAHEDKNRLTNNA